MNKFTPGPWFTSKKGGSFNVDASSGEEDEDFRIAKTYASPFSPNQEESAANTRLICAAPDLLEAQEPDRGGPDFLDWLADRLVNVYGEDPGVDFVIALRRKASKARAAIEKAVKP